MHIIFGYIAFWNLPIIKILKYLSFDVYYLYIDAKTDIKKNEIVKKLKKSNIYPLPIELEKRFYQKHLSLYAKQILMKSCIKKI